MIDNKLRIPAGNTYATGHRVVANDLSGQPIADFDLQQCTDIRVLVRNGGSYKPVSNWTTDDQLVIVLWYGKQMKLGGYDLYIEGKFNGTDWRYSEATIFEIVQFTEEANIPADTILVDGTYFMDAEFTIITNIQGGGGGGTPSSTLPLMDGEASVGTENAYARGDHRHPSDTNKQDVISDLATIRSGAAAGATAVQPAALSGYQPLIDNDNKLDYSLLDNTPTIPAAQVNSDWNADSGVAQILNKPTIPDAQIQSDWNQADNTKKDYIKNKPTIPAAQVQANWNESDTDSKAYIQNKPTIPAAQVQSNWNESDTNSKAYIQNKPTIPAAGIPSGGNAGQVLTKTDGSTDYAVAWRDTNSIFPSAYCTTAAATAAKGASCTFWTATANSYLHILLKNANTNQGALSLNVNSTGAAPIYINGTVSSSTNYTLPAGSYIVFYDGTNYYFRTDGKLTASITGTADGSANVIETVKVNGTALTPDANKAVDVKTNPAVVSHGTSDTTFAVTPNVLHIWGTVGSLTLTLATPTDNTIKNEYMIQFTSGATATQLSLPQGVEWGTQNPEQPNPLVVKANAIYQISIENNIGLWTAIANS